MEILVTCSTLRTAFHISKAELLLFLVDALTAQTLIVFCEVLALTVDFEVDDLECIVRELVEVLDVCEVEILPKFFGILSCLSLLLLSVGVLLYLSELMFLESELCDKLSSAVPHFLSGTAVTEEL